MLVERIVNLSANVKYFTKVFLNRPKTKCSNSLRSLNQRFDKMIRIKFNELENRVSISVRCKFVDQSERDFNLNRSLDEEIGATFEKLYSNYQKHASPKTNKLVKKQKIDEKPEIPEQPPPIYLYDLDNQLIDQMTKNKNAWAENYTLKLNDQTYRVCVNLPSIDKISLSKLILAGLPTVVKIECDSEEIERHSMFSWYLSDSVFSDQDKKAATNDKKKPKSFDLGNVKWKLVDQGPGKRMCILGKESVSRVVKVECVPSDGKREGVAVEAVSANTVLAGPEIESLPMFERHKFTANRLDSDSIRVMSYNILASCYSDTAAAKEELFAHCPLEYLDFKYRRNLLTYEIKNYNSDVVFLQECEKEFFRDDLMPTLGEDYDGRMKIKGEGHEGEAIIFRSDRFKFIQSHDISLTDYMTKNPLFDNIWSNISKNTEYKDFILKRTTVLQVVQVESKENPGHHLLLANSHFFFHPDADFLRLLQAIVSVKYLETLRNEITNKDTNITKIGILFGGDLNSDPTSKAFKYIFSQLIPHEDISEDEKKYMTNCGDELHHSLDLSIYADFKYTNYVVAFQDVIDHLFYETAAFELTRVIPMPPHEKIVENIALPNKFIPSDHLPIIFEFRLKLYK